MLPVLLFLAAVLGHTVLIVAVYNFWYGQPLSRPLSKALRAVHGLIILAGPFALWHLAGLDLPTPFCGYPDEPVRTALAWYLPVCWFLAVAVFPLITARRLLRRPPAALLSNHTEIVDVARHLGHKPIGRSKPHHRLAARLPGNEIFQVDFSIRTFTLPRLPRAWDGLSILHLSDLHFCGIPDREFFREVLDRCNAWEPDLVCVTGDLVDSDKHHRWLVPLLGRLRWRIGAYAILGNHDYWRDPPLLRRRLRRIGMRVVGNLWERTEVRGEPLVVVGHEGPWFQPGPDLTGLPTEGFRLCLSHTPDNIGWAQQHGMDLVLAGHNHGGQVRFPVVGSVFVPSRYGRRYDCGSFHEEPTLMHVSRGLGGEHPLRYNCRPEATKLVLRAPSLEGANS